MHYCTDFYNFTKRITNPVKVGDLTIGGSNDICIQTMTNTPTEDIEKTVKQVISSYKAGASLIRITVPSRKDVENIKRIKQGVIEQGFNIPLVADIHFNQKIAFEAAKIVEKIRINPGNFADTKNFNKLDFTPEEYNSELLRIKSEFIPLIDICKENNTAIRIGSNHGSLSDRIMSKYGDSPEGMAESAMEFLRICYAENFDHVIISMKSSNTLIMVQATRLLVAKMINEGMKYPVHLGVTEAGEGEDGRIKSAVGIGALLADGIGDTIRISLTEPPENEIPVAKKLTDYFKNRATHKPKPEYSRYPINPFSFKRRKTTSTDNIGGNNLPVVLSSESLESNIPDINPDYIITNTKDLQFNDFVEVYAHELTKGSILKLNENPPKALILKTNNKNGFLEQRSAIVNLINSNNKTPVILHRKYSENDIETFQVKASADLGGLLIDGLADGIWLENTGEIAQNDIISTAFGILQASRMRVSKPEYISCPSCGRTLFNLQDTTREIREVTSHLKGLKIGIMGCIVNGLGEMADADYGYIGSGKGKINLYYNKELVKRGIDEKMAVAELIALIKEKGDWHEPKQ